MRKSQLTCQTGRHQEVIIRHNHDGVDGAVSVYNQTRCHHGSKKTRMTETTSAETDGKQSHGMSILVIAIIDKYCLT